MARIDTININDIPAQTNDYAPIPAGEYIATIKDAEVKVTKDGTGQYIKLKLQIDAPSNTGRVIFSNLNIQNKSEAAERIGRQQLGEIMRALGLSSVADTDQLVGGTIGIKVAIREAQNGYEAQNEVKGYKSMKGSAPPAADAPAGNAKATPPWAKK
jgi:hypothetical protein